MCRLPEFSPSVCTFPGLVGNTGDKLHRHVLHCEAELLSFRVPVLAGGPCLRLDLDWAPWRAGIWRDVGIQHTLSGLHRSSRKVGNEAGMWMEKGGPVKNGPGGYRTWMSSSRWMCLQRQEEEVQRARWAAPCPLSWSEFTAQPLPWEQVDPCVPGMYLKEGS